MATSSILTNIKITDKKSAERFVSALDAADKVSHRVPTTRVNPPLKDKKAISVLMAKRIGKQLGERYSVSDQTKYIQFFKFI